MNYYDWEKTVPMEIKGDSLCLYPFIFENLSVVKIRSG